jgi:hypothetical protein
VKITVFQENGIELTKLSEFDFRLFHYRNRDQKGRITQNGGGTVMSIVNPLNGKLNVFNIGCSTKDRFSRRHGRELVLRKIIGKLYKKQVLNVYPTPETNNGSFTVEVK